MRIDIELWTKHFNNFHLGKKCPKASLSLADIAGSPGEGHPFKQVDLTQVQLGQLNIFENNSTYFGMPLMLMSPFQEQSISIVTVSKHEGTLKGSWKLNLKDKFIVVQTKQKIQPKAFGNTCLVFFFFHPMRFPWTLCRLLCVWRTLRAQSNMLEVVKFIREALGTRSATSRSQTFLVLCEGFCWMGLCLVFGI